MIEKLNYISDDELEQLICRVEQEELVTAPPDMMESILEAVEQEEKAEPQPVAVSRGKNLAARKKEFRAYCFRVVTSVAAAIALVFLLPDLTEGMNFGGMPVAEPVNKSDVIETVPVQAEVVKVVPDKAAVVAVKPTPSKEEVLNDTGFIEKVVSNTIDWLNKESKEQ